jgi:hypothetical protein
MYAMTQGRRNGRGQAVALGLVRAVLRGANLLSAMRHNEAMRARLSEDFGGYLVTDETDGWLAEISAEVEADDMLGPVADWALDCEPMTEAEIMATDGGRHCAPGFGAFSRRRADYEPRRVSVLETGFQFFGEGGPLDAPEWLAAGGVKWINGIGIFPAAVVRP